LRARTPRGFTLIEMMVVVGIIGVLTWLAMDGFRRVKPAAALDSIAADLHSTVHFARQHALSTGHNVAVLIFPDYPNGKGRGRYVLLEDEPTNTGLASFFSSAGTPNFASCDPAQVRPTPNGKLLDTQDFPIEVRVGPANGNGLTSGLPFPYNGVKTDVACSFCTGSSGNGAIVFDSHGRVSFYTTSGSTIEVPTGQEVGGSLTLYGFHEGVEMLKENGSTPYHTNTMIVTAPIGTVRTFWHGEDKR
jgi:prepilin-type N-terminal cleavage/methylation domain-containing protein